MIKRIIIKLAKGLLYWSFNYLYNYIDSDADGSIDKKELEQFAKNLKRIINKRKY